MKEMIYLDNASTTFPKPDSTHEFMSSFFREYGVNPGRSGCDAALRAEEMINDTRVKLSAFFNASLTRAGKTKDPNRLVFTHNATHALNMVLRGTLSPGDHVVTTMVEHNSVIRPINHLKKTGVEATFVVPDGEGYVDPEDIRKAIKANTRLVIVNHGSNVIGVVQDVEAIGRVCAEEGVPFALDTAQTAGVIPIDMAEAHVSFLTFTGHKALFGPTGTGGICVADDAEIASSEWGGTGVKSAYPYHLEEYPYRLEAGTLNLMGIAGLHAGLEWVLERGVDSIRRHEMELLRVLQDGLSEVPGITIHGTTNLERRVATLSITIKNWDPSDVGTFLDVDYDIITRTGLQCAPLIHEHMGTAPRGTVRFSLGPFTTLEQVTHAIRAAEEISAKQNGG